jgi:hypothetical protein
LTDALGAAHAAAEAALLEARGCYELEQEWLR